MADPYSPVAIQDTIIAATAEVTRRRLAAGPDTARRDFGSLGVDSVNVFEIVLKLEERYGVTLADTFLFTHRTPAEAAAAIHDMLGGAAGTDSPGAGSSE